MSLGACVIVCFRISSRQTEFIGRHNLMVTLSSLPPGSLIYQFVLCIVLLLFVQADRLGAAETLEVTVTGVEGKAYENILSRLRIYRLSQRDEQLDNLEVTRLHRLAPQDIEAALAPYGYHSVQVKSDLIETENGWQVSYDVEPGRQVYITSVSITVITISVRSVSSNRMRYSRDAGRSISPTSWINSYVL